MEKILILFFIVSCVLVSAQPPPPPPPPPPLPGQDSPLPRPSRSIIKRSTGNRHHELDEDVKQDLMKGLEDTSEDRASVWTPFGVQEQPAFHCTFLNNMPGTTVCCTFTSYQLLQCYTPPNYHVPWAM